MVKKKDKTAGVKDLPSKKQTSLSKNKSTVGDNSAKQQNKQMAEQVTVVGIGASAGGLEAFRVFFNAMPADSGLAFVLIAHLSPDHASLLPELIQRNTKMTVVKITDHLKIEANCIYVIPPKKEITLLKGILQVADLPHPHGLNRPIDTFFQSLAQDKGNKAIAIILSGTGSDGCLGLRAIKSEAGLVMAEDPKSAKYDGMPRNAIATGLVDYVLIPEKMPDSLIKFNQHLSYKSATRFDSKSDDFIKALQKIYIVLRSKTGHDFSLYKKNTIFRRIERRMLVHQIDEIDNYVRYLQECESEVVILFKELLIGVTGFFRDKDAFEALINDYIPKFLQDKPNEYQVRVWVPGCSSGEEVYSIAISLYECMKKINRHFNVQVFGTDIDETAIEKARTGRYPESIAMDLSPQQLKEYFIKEDQHYQIKKAIREMVVFAEQNIIKDPPFINLDLLCCRNLLIYFGSELQKQLLPMFHYSLKSDGILFLGSSESVGQATDMFTCIDKKWKIYKRISPELVVNPSINLTLKPPYTPMSEKKITMSPIADVETSSLKLLKTILAESEMSARIVIDSQANIVYVHGKTGQYLEPAEGAVSTNIIEMARPGLKAGLTNGIHHASSGGKAVEIQNLRIKTNGGFIALNLHIKPLPAIQVGKEDLLMVIFEEAPSQREDTDNINSGHNEEISNSELKQLESELLYTRENLQSTIEELETANEELKSTNEELQSTNEELQSTNEELETSKEELQSLNEESTTVNSELQSRIDDLMNAKDDIKNLLDATDIASIFLDIDLNIRRFTPKAIDIFPLTEADFARPIRHFASNLKEVNLHQLAQQVLNDLAMVEQEVNDFDEKVYRMRIRPYRTTNNVIDGIVITFEDITKIKKIESELNQISNEFEENLLMMSKVFMDGADPIIIENLDGTILDLNDEACRCYGWQREELIGKNIRLLVPEEYFPEAEKFLKQCKTNKVPVRNVEGLRQHKSGQIIKVLLTYSLLTNLEAEICAIATIAKNYPPQT